MDVRAKIVNLLSESFKVDYVRLEEDDGISGFVVSPEFLGVSSLDRQRMIETALRQRANPLTPQENRQILMIAALTPVEYDSVGARVRVHQIREMTGGAFQIVLHGGPSDAEYVREVIRNQKGVEAGIPEQCPGAIGILMSFQAERAAPTPLTKAEILRALKKDQYIQVMPNA